MNDAVEILDVIALTKDLPDRGLFWGQVGTVVESLVPGVVEVEFSDEKGRSYASLALKANQFLVLHYAPVKTGQTTLRTHYSCRGHHR